jgi:hypothetical protein
LTYVNSSTSCARARSPALAEIRNQKSRESLLILSAMQKMIWINDKQAAAAHSVRDTARPDHTFTQTRIA